MWKSLASSLVTCLIHDKWLCEKPWMKTISGPAGLPQSCAEIVSPSGVFTQTCLNFFSCAMVGTALAVRISAAMDVPARRRTNDRCVMANGPPFVLSAVFLFGACRALRACNVTAGGARNERLQRTRGRCRGQSIHVGTNATGQVASLG